MALHDAVGAAQAVVVEASKLAQDASYLLVLKLFC